MSKYFGIQIEGGFFQKNKIVKLLNNLRDVDSYSYGLVIKYIDKISISNNPTRAEGGSVVLNKYNLNLMTRKRHAPKTKDVSAWISVSYHPAR